MTKQKRMIIWSVLAVLVLILAVFIGLNLTISVKTPTPVPTATPVVSPSATTITPVGSVIGPETLAGFEPSSASFISPQIGFVFGVANCGPGSCPAIAKTKDGGKSWSLIQAPVSLVREGNLRNYADYGMRFVDELNGYVYGPDLYATHDGGVSWQKITLEGLPTPSSVFSLETTGTKTYLIAGTPNVDPSPNYLYISNSPAGDFVQSKYGFPTGTPTRISANAYGAVIVANNSGALALPTDPNGYLYYQASETSTWTHLKAKCPGDFPGTPVAALASPVSGSTTPQLLLGCGGGVAAGSQEKTVLKSTDLTTFTKTKKDPPLSGDLEAIASPDGKTIAVGASSGATFIYVSSDGGTSWKTAFSDTTSGGSLVHDLVFIDATKGSAVEGYATTPGTRTSIFLIMTRDRGISWQEITF